MRSNLLPAGIDATISFDDLVGLQLILGLIEDKGNSCDFNVAFLKVVLKPLLFLYCLPHSTHSFIKSGFVEHE